MRLLRIEHPVELISCRRQRIRNIGNLAADGLAGILEVAPRFRSVHVDRALWGPDPVFFVARSVWRADRGNPDIFTLGDLVFPLHPRKIDPPLLSVRRRAIHVRMFCHPREGEGDFHGPVFICVGRVVKRSFYKHAGFLPRHFAEDRLAAVLVGAGH